MKWGTSKGFQFDKNDLWAVLANAALVGLAAAATFAAETLANVDLGAKVAVVIPIVVVALNSFARWASDYTKKKG